MRPWPWLSRLPDVRKGPTLICPSYSYSLIYIKESNKAKLFSQLALYYSVFGTVFLPLPPWKKESVWQRSRHLASDDKLLDSRAVRWAQVTMGQHCDTDTPTPAPLTRGGSDGSKLVIKFFTIPSERRWYRHRAGQCKLPDPPPICQILTQANNNFSGVVGAPQEGADCKPKYFDVVVVAVRIQCWAKQGESGVKLLCCGATVSEGTMQMSPIVPTEVTLAHGHGGSRVWDTPGIVLR